MNRQIETGTWRVEDDEVIYVSQEVIQSFNLIFNKLEQAQQKFVRVTEAMRPIEGIGN